MLPKLSTLVAHIIFRTSVEMGRDRTHLLDDFVRMVQEKIECLDS
jgi:hypothetical protein